MLDKLGEIMLEEGVEPGEISKKIAEETGMSYRWVTKYLSERYKDKSQSEKASSAARRAAGFLDNILKPPKHKEALKINKYGNVEFVMIALKRSFYDEFERYSSELGISSELSVMKAIEEYCQKLRRGVVLKRQESKVNRT